MFTVADRRPEVSADGAVRGDKPLVQTKEKARNLNDSGPSLLRGQDLNLRPLGYEPSELPNCSTPRHKK